LIHTILLRCKTCDCFPSRETHAENAKNRTAAGRPHSDDGDPSARKVVITRDDGKEDLVIEV